MNADPGPSPSNDNLSSSTARGVAWMGLATAGQLVLQLAVLAMLARLVGPKQFGIVSIGVMAIQLGQLLAESTIGPALVQRRTIDRSHVRVAFTFSLSLALVLWAALAASAEPVAGFFNSPESAPILKAVGVVFVIRNATLGDFLLARKMRFKHLALIELTSYGLGYGAIAVGFALQGAGAWAIVAGQIGQAAIRTGLLWRVEAHSVVPSLSWTPLKSLLGYGAGHFLTRITHYFGNQVDNFVVARALGPTQLGLYGRAYQMMRLPAHLFGQSIGEVLFPAMAKVQDDPPRLARAYSRAMGITALISVPASAMAAILSQELVVLLLGGRWQPAVPAVRIMALGILFAAGSKLSDALARATGAVYRRAWRQFAYAAGVLGAAVAGSSFGLGGVATGVLLVNVGNFLLMAHLGLSLAGMKWRSLVAAHVPALIMGSSVTAGVWGAAHSLRTLDAHPLTVVAACSLIGALIALGIARVAPRMKMTLLLAETLGTAKEMIGPGTGARLLARALGPSYRSSAAQEALRTG